MHIILCSVIVWGDFAGEGLLSISTSHLARHSNLAIIHLPAEPILMARLFQASAVTTNYSQHLCTSLLTYLMRHFLETASLGKIAGQILG